MTTRFCICILFLALLSAQSLFPQGLASEWEVRKDMSDLATAVKRLKPVLDQVKPREWLAKGAPEAYVGQTQSAQAEVGYLVQSTEILSREPEKMSAALDTIFRMENLEAVLHSLVQGIRRYQNPALGDSLAGLLAQNANQREKLREYVLDLVKDKESQLKVMNEEAQRCRDTLMRQSVAPPKPARKTERK